MQKNAFTDKQDIMKMLSQATTGTKSKKLVVKPTQDIYKENAASNEKKDDYGVPANKEVGTVKVTGNGIRVLKNGTLTVSRFLGSLNYDGSDYAELTFTNEEALSIQNSLRAMSTGMSSAIPLKCGGYSCPFASTCPYIAAQKPPIGKPCLVEKELLSYWIQQFIKEFDVNANNFTEMQLVCELAEFNIYELRVTKHLAEHQPTLMQKIVVGIDNSGNAIENEDISKAYQLKERIKAKRMKVLEALMATRKEKVVTINAEKGGSTSTATKITELRDKLDHYMGEIHALQKQDTVKEVKT